MSGKRKVGSTAGSVDMERLWRRIAGHRAKHTNPSRSRLAKLVTRPSKEERRTFQDPSD